MRLRTVGAVLIGATAVAALAAGGAAAAPDGDPTLVPGAVHLPLPLTRTVRDAPAGPAALIVTGEGALRGSDVLGGYEGRTLVVGGDGRYRLVAGAAQDEAGDGAHLSPDGRLLAVTGPVDRAPEVPFSATSLVDLVTGEVRAVGAGRPVGWAPDGRLLVRTRHDALDLVDVDTGRAARLVGYVNPIAFGRTAPRWPSRATTPSRSSACRTARSAAR